MASGLCRKTIKTEKKKKSLPKDRQMERNAEGQGERKFMPETGRSKSTVGADVALNYHRVT